MSFFLLAPFCVFKEGATFTPAGLKALGVANTDLVIKQALLAGVCFHAYQQVCCFPHVQFSVLMVVVIARRKEQGNTGVVYVNGHGSFAEHTGAIGYQDYSAWRSLPNEHRIVTL